MEYLEELGLQVYSPAGSMISSDNSTQRQTDNLTALVAEETLTFAEARQRGGAIARALAEAGLATGDVVAVATAHRSSFYCCFAGCYAAGFPIAVLDPSAAIQELALMLRKAAPSALIADDAILRRLVDTTDAELPEVIRGIPGKKASGKFPRWLSSWLDLRTSRLQWPPLPSVPQGRVEPGFAPVPEEQPAYVIFTSGTTSKPKAAVISRAALQYHVGTLSRVFGYGEDARLLCYFPTHHTDGLVHGVAASLLTGMTVVQPGRFTNSTDLEHVLRSNRISHFLAVPTMLAMIKRTFGDRPKLFQFEGFRSLISTAGYLDEALWKGIENLFNIRVSNFYGMTETVSGSLYCGPDDAQYRFGTLGKPVDAEVRIVSEGGEEVPANTVGELQIAGQHLMSGYLDDREATQAVMTDGWLSTGDLFTRDECGVFRFRGRLKNIIKRGGITVYPEDVRNVVGAMPGVLEVEVLGVPHTMFEETIAVCAVVEAGIDSEQLRAWCRNRLSPERRPDRIELMESLPRGPSGKVLQDALLSALGERRVGIDQPPTSHRDRVIGLAAEIFSVERSALDETSSPDTVEDWDSYASMELVIALEKEFAIRLKPHAIMRMRDLGRTIEIVGAEVVRADSAK